MQGVFSNAGALILSLFNETFSHISPHHKLVPDQYQEYENGVFGYCACIHVPYHGPLSSFGGI